MKPFLLAALLAAAAWPARAETVTLSLPTVGSLEADYRTPTNIADLEAVPGVIYLHGRYVRELGYEGAARHGYDLAEFVAAFADAGFAAIAPLRREPVDVDGGDRAVTEGLAAVLAALDHLRAQPKVDARRIAVAGFGEGGLIALWALARIPDLAAGVVLSPVQMTRGTGRAETMNVDEFLAGGALESVRAPVFLAVAGDESRTARRHAERLAAAMVEARVRFLFVRNYRGTQRLFRRPDESYMRDVIAFLNARLR